MTAGFAAALLAMIVKAETDNVIVARAKSGLPATHGDEALAPSRAGPGAGSGSSPACCASTGSPRPSSSRC